MHLQRNVDIQYVDRKKVNIIAITSSAQRGGPYAGIFKATSQPTGLSGGLTEVVTSMLCI